MEITHGEGNRGEEGICGVALKIELGANVLNLGDFIRSPISSFLENQKFFLTQSSFPCHRSLQFCGHRTLSSPPSPCRPTAAVVPPVCACALDGKALSVMLRGMCVKDLAQQYIPTILCQQGYTVSGWYAYCLNNSAVELYFSVVGTTSRLPPLANKHSCPHTPVLSGPVS